MTRVGLAYQSPLRSFMERARDAFDFVEVVPDMFWNDLGRDRTDRHQLSPEGHEFLAWASALGKPVIPHSIGLSIGSADRFDRAHVAQMDRWRGWLDFPWHSDHLSFHLAEHGDVVGQGSDAGAVNLGITLPLAFDRQSLDLLVPRIQEVRRSIPRPFLLENSAYYFQLPDEEFTEAQFLNQLCAESGAHLVLDLHNLHVNDRNGVVDAGQFLADLDLGRVMEIHLAGGMELDGFYLDAHSGPVPEPVWQMLAQVLPRCPHLGGVVFEIFGSWFAGLGEDALERELRRLRAMLEAAGAVGLAGGGGVSLVDFQACLARLITEAELAERVIAGGDGSGVFGGRQLTTREQRRLQAVARSPGLAITRKLHRGFRLGKLLSMLPLSCARLGDDLLGQVASDFWRQRPSRSFYFWEEAVGFCDHLAPADAPSPAIPPLPFLAEVVSYERATLLLQCAPERLPSAGVALLWPADPRPVLQALATQKAIPELASVPHLMVGARAAGGGVTWSLRR